MQSEVCARRAAATSYRLCSDATKPSKNMSINAGGDNEAHTRARSQRSVLSPSRTRCNNSAGALNPNAERTHSVSHRRMAESALATFVIFLFRCFVELMRLTLDFVCLLLLLGAHDPAVQQQYRSRESRVFPTRQVPRVCAGRFALHAVALAIYPESGLQDGQPVRVRLQLRRGVRTRGRRRCLLRRPPHPPVLWTADGAPNSEARRCRRLVR